ncbi:MAG TPA: hypothetical protein VMF08_14365 [Candidatus Sulfotelmatobacter sp.]|nr:hypothetical protein [Candidatus Sulfotelmatobacter sp.]
MSTITSERYQVAEAALRHVMDEYSASSAERAAYSAYALDGGEFTLQLVIAFSGYKPKVEANIQIQFAPNGVPTNKADGKSVELWTVENIKIHDDHATANVQVYQSSEGMEYYTVRLRHLNGKWVFESKTLDIVS